MSYENWPNWAIITGKMGEAPLQRRRVNHNRQGTEMSGKVSLRRDLLAAVLVTGSLTAPLPGAIDAMAAETGDTGDRLHGALDMQQQQQRLNALLGDRDVTEPPAAVDPYIWNAIIVPEDNRMTAERVELGRKLYFDTRLSADNTVACATCHDVSRAFADLRPVSEGIGGQLGRRNAPTTLNALFMETQFWDGRAATLEAQAALPIINSIEMGQPHGQAAEDAIKDDADYRRMFQAAYDSEPNYRDMARAIAAFERTLVFLDAPFDRFLAGDEQAISQQARQGWELFNGKARCVTCHAINPSNPIASDSRFHNIGVAARTQNFEKLAREALAALRDSGDPQAVDELALNTNLSELGRFLVTKDRADIGAFKTEQLRNIGITAPYMHDGSMRTLWDVMDHYNKGGEPNPYLDGGIEPLALSEDEIDDLVALMFTLTDDRFAEENRKAFDEQREIASQRRPFRDTAMAMGEVLPFERRVMEQTN